MIFARVLAILLSLFAVSFCCRFSVVATQTFKLPLRVVQFAFEKMEHERDVDEIECLLANLIFRVSHLFQLP